MQTIPVLHQKYEQIKSTLTERARRRWAAAEARSIGRGGVSQVCAATGLSRTTIHSGLRELDEAPAADPLSVQRSRRPGGGRKPLSVSAPGLVEALNDLVSPATRGDPMSPLRWTSKSTSKLAKELTAKGFPVSQRSVCDLLAHEGYSLQSLRKTTEGKQHEDRDAQFNHLNKRVVSFLKLGQPVISVDTKKKELVGDFTNKGREYQPKGKPVPVRVHDFVDKKLGKAAPYGVYDLAANQGWVSVGVDHDTSAFAVESIRRWWKNMGQPLYPEAKKLLITADGGGSNGSRVRLWKVELQKLADELDMEIAVSHFPPGTSKWNKIEHRMFSYISANWRGQSLISHEVIIALIGATTSEEGLKIKARIDRGIYPIGIEITPEQMARVNLARQKFHGEWNYSISPTKK
jgi:Rhodopirellula transposase DDE domain